jgi:hypothetical protein
MNEKELKYLKEYVARQAHQFAVAATVTYDAEDGFITVDVVTKASSGQPRSVKRSAKFESRAQAEAFIDHAVRAASVSLRR